MDVADKVSITVCGDGGCGESYLRASKAGRLSLQCQLRNNWLMQRLAARTVSSAIEELFPLDSAYETLEDSYSVNRKIDGLNYFLSLTDTAGQEEYRGLWAASNLQSDAFLLVYDITNASSLPALDHFMQMIDMEAESRMDAGGVPPIKIVAGNKCDLQGSRQIRSAQGLEWARSRKCGFMETSARELVNIEETFAREISYQKKAPMW
ncbi:MAG: hypothetical protein M1827_000165 [Pycnora praestabilis]|nr:MAG: hypothetical protein M1827_000165 [Pycnora praestabilis]